MNLETNVMTALKSAMKSKNQGEMRALRAIKSAIQIMKTDGSNSKIDEAAEIKLLQKLIKQRQDSLEIYESQNRDDLAEKEKEEIAVIQTFLPEQMEEEKLTQFLTTMINDLGATGMQDMGKVMGLASSKLQGKADGKAISTIVKKILTN